MRERRYLTFDMENQRHRRAFAIFSTQASKLRSEFVVNCILACEDEKFLEKTIRHTIEEALKDVSFSVSNLREESVELQMTENVAELPDVLLTSLDDI